MDGVDPRQKYNAGIKVVYNQITRQVGLSYLSGTVVLRAPFSFIPAGYFGLELAVCYTVPVNNTMANTVINFSLFNSINLAHAL